MSDHSLPDDSISILEDLSTSGYQGNAGVGIPQFHIYSGQPSNVEEASHYALNLTCRSLQKRNRELEHQLQSLKTKRRSPPVVSVDGEMSLSPRPQRHGASPDAMTTSHNGTHAEQDYIQYLEDILTTEQASKRELASKLEHEQNVNHQNKTKIQSANQELDESLSLLSSRGLEIEDLRHENEILKSTVIELRKEAKAHSGPSVSVQQNNSRALEGRITQLNAELSSMQQLYEEAATKTEHLEGRSSTWGREKSELEETIAEKDKMVERLRVSTIALEEQRNVLELANSTISQTSRQTDVGTASPALGAGSDEDLLRGTKLEISALQVQVIEMQGVIRDQTSLIRLLGTKLRSRSQGESGLYGSRSITPTNVNTPLNSFTPPRPGSGARGHVQRQDSPVFVMEHTERRPSSGDIPESKPIYCEEDLESLGNDTEEPVTLIMSGSPVSGGAGLVENAGRVDALRFSAITRPQPLSNPPIFGLVSNSEPCSSGASGSTDIHQVTSSSAVIRQVSSSSSVIRQVSSSSPVIHQVASSPAIAQQARNLPQFSFLTEAVVPPRVNTEPIISRPPAMYHTPPGEPERGSVPEPMTAGDNRLSAAGAAAPSNRQIPIERNLDPPPSSHNNRTHNVNLVEMAADKHIGVPPSGGQQVLNNHPLHGNKSIPQRNIYTATTDRTSPTPGNQRWDSPTRTCPICNQEFPMETAQRDFETHVEICLSSAVVDEESSPPPSSPEEANGGGGTTSMMECPVCQAVFPPGTGQEMFETHVEAHFPGSDYDGIAPESEN